MVTQPPPVLWAAELDKMNSVHFSHSHTVQKVPLHRSMGFFINCFYCHSFKINQTELPSGNTEIGWWDSRTKNSKGQAQTQGLREWGQE